MALAALIAAYHESGEAGVLRATLPLAGRTVIERQARLAFAAGAARIILFVERMPPDLSAAIDRLRAARLPIHVARSAEEAAEAVDPSDRLLLVADGAIAEAAQMTKLADSEGYAVLTVPDGAYGELYERIDASSRWAGLAAMDGEMLRKTIAMLRDWDLQSTLLRRTLQAEAAHVAADGPVAILDSSSDLATLERAIISAAAASAASGGGAARMLAPIERLLTLSLLGSRVGPAVLGTASVFLTAAGGLFIGYGWFLTGLALMLVGTPLDGVADRLARIRMQGDIGRHWWSYLNPAFAGAALIALAYGLAISHGWGMVLLALTTLAFLVALGIETEGRKLKAAILLAERKGMTWLMLPFAVFDLWHAGLALLFAYAAGSFFWAQNQAHTAVRTKV